MPIAAYVVATRRDWRFIAWAVPPVAFQAWYGAVYFGNPLRTQYSIAGGMFSMDLGEGLYGVLLSAGRGFFAYSPIFVLSVVGAVLAWRPGGDRLLICFASAFGARPPSPSRAWSCPSSWAAHWPCGSANVRDG